MVYFQGSHDFLFGHYILAASTQFFLRFGVAWGLVVDPLALPSVNSNSYQCNQTTNE